MLLDTIVKDNDLRDEPLYNQNIQKAVGKVIEETEGEFERNYKKSRAILHISIRY